MHTTTCIPLSYCTSAAARRSRNETQAGPESVGSNGTKWSVLTKSERERQRKRERARESLLVTKLREVLAALVSLLVVVPFPQCSNRWLLVPLLLSCCFDTFPCSSAAAAFRLRRVANSKRRAKIITSSASECHSVCEWVRIAISIGRQQQ